MSDFITKIKTAPVWVFYIVIAIVGLLIGMAVSAGNHSEAAVPAVKPKVITKTVTQVKTVETVPQSCLDALDAADAGFSVAADMIGKYTDGISQITSNQISAAYQTIDDIKGLNTKLDGITPKYVNGKEACRSAAVQ